VVENIIARVVVSVVVHRDMAHLLLHLAHILEMLTGELDSASLQFTDESAGDVLTGYLQGVHGVRQGISFENRNSVCDTFTALSNQTACFTC